MQTVLSQLNRLPGVIGSMVCGGDGSVLAQAFPTVFDPGAIQEAARALADGAQALEPTSEADDLLDLRFREVRLLAKSCSGNLLAILCSRTTNFQLLVLSMTAAGTKLDRVLQARAPEPPAQEAAAAPVAASVAARPGAERPAATSKVAAPTRGLDELRRRLLDQRESTGERSLGAGLPLEKP